MDGTTTQQQTQSSSASVAAAAATPAQQSHSAAFQQNAQLPQAQLDLLAQFTPEQLAAIGQLYATGALQIPLVPPAPVAIPSQSRPAIESELEDGELDDDEPVTPKVAMDEPVSIKTNDEVYLPRPEKRRYSSPPSDQIPKRRLSDHDFMQQQRASEDFVRVMLRNGFGYDKLKDQVSDAEQLWQLYERLSLPTTVALKPAASLPVTASQPATKRSFSVQTQAPVDRQEYLARLQAAKNKKSDIPATAVATAPQTKPKKTLDPQKTLLLKQKLAARKAELANTELRKSDLAALPSAVQSPALIETSSCRSSASERPLDSGANSAAAHRLVIPISDVEDDSDESELDDDSDNAGVSLAQPSLYDANAYEIKARELAAAKQQIADMEERARSRNSLALTPIVQHNVSTELNTLLTGIQPQFNTLTTGAAPSALPEQQVSDADVLEDDDEAYDDIYNTSAAAAEPQPTSTTPIDPVEQGSDSEEETPDTEMEDTEDFYNAPQAEAVPDTEAVLAAVVFPAPGTEPFPTDVSTIADNVNNADDEDEDSDVSMDISEDESSEDDTAEPDEDSSDHTTGAAPGLAVAISNVPFTDQSSLASSAHVPAQEARPAVKYKHFTPYESPLNSWKDQQSTNPSHHIDSYKILCPNETGQNGDSMVCNIQDCPFQHFDQLENSNP